MKTLILVRHAKSSWANIGEQDFDRSLNDRGKKDAPEMAERLMKRRLSVGAFVSSPAKRATMTCKAFCEVFGYKKDKIIFINELYHADPAVFEIVVRELPANVTTVALFSHNPGITGYVNSLCKDVHIDNMPTCAVFAAEADVNEWKEFKDSEKKFLFMDYPKMVRES